MMVHAVSSKVKSKTETLKLQKHLLYFRLALRVMDIVCRVNTYCLGSNMTLIALHHRLNSIQGTDYIFIQF